MNTDLFIQSKSNQIEKVELWVYRTSNGVEEVWEKETPNTEKLEFFFRKMNYGTWFFLEEECWESIEVQDGERFNRLDQEKMKILYLRFFLAGWNLDEELFWEEDGGLTEESLSKVLALDPKILRVLTDQIEKEGLTSEEEAILVKQSHLLFGKKSQGVATPHRLISLYCNLVEMWSEFGLNYFDLQKMPIKERMALRKIIQVKKQVDAQEAKQKQLQSQSGRGFRGRRMR